VQVDVLAATGAGSRIDVPVTYDPTTSTFTGSLSFTTSLAGPYLVKVKFYNTLRKQALGIYLGGREETVQRTVVIPGDTVNDNVLNILDYNRILDCYSDLLPPVACSDPAKKRAGDITYDGNVNQFDYNLFIRALQNVSGA
jgi:hypothetical protein